MSDAMMSSRYWFRPKVYGYGATPVSWEGWALVAAHFVLVAVCVAVMLIGQVTAAKTIGSILLLAIATFIVVWLSAIKTDGSWRWRWGASKNSDEAK
jgi:cytochrome b561